MEKQTANPFKQIKMDWRIFRPIIERRSVKIYLESEEKSNGILNISKSEAGVPDRE